MNRDQKEIFIKNIKTIVDDNSLVLVFHYRGMSMNEMTDLRVQSFNSGCNIKVTNNRLAKLALKETNKVDLSDFFDGPTAIAYSNDPVSLTKLLVEFSKNNNKLKWYLPVFFCKKRKCNDPLFLLFVSIRIAFPLCPL